MVTELRRVLVTGQRGKIGARVVEQLIARGVETVGLDVGDGVDIRDVEAVRERARGCDAVIHLAALAHDALGTPAEIFSANIEGTWAVLQAAHLEQLPRVVFASSIQYTGLVQGELPPAYLPLDDDHPSFARSPYSLSKSLGEKMCRSFTETTGIPTICIRPPLVLTDEELPGWDDELANPSPGADALVVGHMWCHVDDVAAAFIRAAEADVEPHTRFLLSAEDIAGPRRTREVLARLGLEDRWRGGDAPYVPFVDASRARVALDWSPTHHWPRAEEAS